MNGALLGAESPEPTGPDGPTLADDLAVALAALAAAQKRWRRALDDPEAVAEFRAAIERVIVAAIKNALRDRALVLALAAGARERAEIGRKLDLALMRETRIAGARARRSLAVERAPSSRAVEGAPRPREHRRRANRARAPGGSDDPDPDPLAPRPCVGCGEMFRPARRAQTYCAEDACRKARNRAKAAASRARHPELKPELMCPSCGDMRRRLDERTGWCRRCTGERAELPARLEDARKLRHEIAIYSALRHVVWLELPSANGSRENLRRAAVRLTRRIDDTWAMVRAAERAPRFVERQGARVDAVNRELSRAAS